MKEKSGVDQALFGKRHSFHLYGMPWEQFECISDLHNDLRWPTDASRSYACYIFIDPGEIKP